MVFSIFPWVFLWVFQIAPGTDRLGTMAASTKPTLGTKVQAVRRRRSTFCSRTLVAKGLVSKLTRGYLAGLKGKILISLCVYFMCIDR